MKQGLSKAALALSLMVGLSGCVNPVFNGPVGVSTKSEVAKHVTLIGPVSVEKADSFFVIFPVINDPRMGFDELMEQARSLGGDCVIDFQIHDEGNSFMCIPLVIIHRYSYSGIAARTDK